MGKKWKHFMYYNDDFSLKKNINDGWLFSPKKNLYYIRESTMFKR